MLSADVRYCRVKILAFQKQAFENLCVFKLIVILNHLLSIYPDDMMINTIRIHNNIEEKYV